MPDPGTLGLFVAAVVVLVIIHVSGSVYIGLGLAAAFSGSRRK
jgi:hypothetical protein